MHTESLSGLVLAGGQGRRMGGRDKGLEPFADGTLIDYACRPLRRHVNELLINANRHLETYRQYGGQVIVDRQGGYQGPLMGIWSGLCAAHTQWLVIVPCDSPMLPECLVERLWQGKGEHDIAVAHDGERAHPVVALMRTSLAGDLESALQAGERKIDRWYDRHAWCYVDFSDCPAAFVNLNSEDDKTMLEERLASRTG
ncbi:molybdenum cofactor guanylyltransferase MobA [Aidingimonas halophila]|uniref:Molybdenum cofactor guanylyltransferase n=1 Tax=Aidingimonas halophila TaxID=574349 RepID=A0A1H3B3P8_9GAMM|nr:molybdenum cofactor guanylyltransferase MobA [Aidingimonas halophila]GHC25809.1 molybdenum cofactor guanylyltransferase [Aidingimonas halophila]SDX36241.1 molybdenum cofactor guanylyltransferase [Aidingimonas halophila]